VTLYRPHQATDRSEQQATLRSVAGGYVLQATLPDGSLTALLPADDDALLRADGITAQGAIKLRLERREQAAQIIEVRERGQRD
ncbi:MAG: hypothetical protein MUC88_18910, partial [Planctomycetes bacterium]|nr:hypothetical protein [Planctomycetota bacterium]